MTDDHAALARRLADLERNVKGWVEWHRRCDADDDCTYLNDNAWCDAEALASTGMGLLARPASEPSEGDDAMVERVAKDVADRCHGNRKPGSAANRYATIYQAAALGAHAAIAALRGQGVE